MKEIGGYFSLEIGNRKEYYPDLIKLNTGRNCLEYILKVRKYNKIYIPYYTCEAILEPLRKLNVFHEFYHVNKKLEPIFEKKLKQNEAILINNYFGIKEKAINEICRNYYNVIVDNSQAFFAKPVHNIDTFYSIRKFFGVADGAYLSINKKLNQNLKTDISYKRMSHLLIRLDKSASFAYESYKQNDDKLIDIPTKKMSKLTQAILRSIDYEEVKKIREKNFKKLHSTFQEFNELEIDTYNLQGPMVYPFVINGEDLRQHFVKNKIFIATYWPNVYKWCNESQLEYQMTKKILPIPIDQRYDENDMDNIIAIFNTWKKDRTFQFHF